MRHSRFMLLATSYSAALFLGMLLFLEIGWRYGRNHAVELGAGARVGVGVVDGAIYALLALLLGFTFSSATTRFETRKQLIIQKVTAIGIAWARLSLLPPDVQPAMRVAFRRYVDALVAFNAQSRDATEDEYQNAMNERRRLRSELWTVSAATCLRDEGEKARMLVLPGLNDMYTAVEKERLAELIHPPYVIYLMLAVAAFIGALFAGYGMSAGPRNLFYWIGLSTVIASVSYVILDLEFPRLGLIRVDRLDGALVELRESLDRDS